MSTKVIASIAVILATVLPMFGVEIGSDALMATITNIVYIASGLWVWFRTVTKEDVNAFGMRKEA